MCIFTIHEVYDAITINIMIKNYIINTSSLERAPREHNDNNKVNLPVMLLLHVLPYYIVLLT